MENALIEVTEVVTRNKNATNIPYVLLEEQEQQQQRIHPNGNILKNISIDDLRSLSTEPYMESVFSWEIIPDQICRLCATKNELHPKQSLVRWLGLLNEIVPGMVALADGLSQFICRPCTNKLYTCNKLKQTFIEANKTLQENKKFNNIKKYKSLYQKNNQSCYKSKKNESQTPNLHCYRTEDARIKIEKIEIELQDDIGYNEIQKFEIEDPLKIENIIKKEIEESQGEINSHGSTVSEVLQSIGETSLENVNIGKHKQHRETDNKSDKNQCISVNDSDEETSYIKHVKFCQFTDNKSSNKKIDHRNLKEDSDLCEGYTFECPVCLKKFANENSKYKHMNATCTSIICIVCKQMFHTVAELKQHRLSKHSIKEIEEGTKLYEKKQCLCCEMCSLNVRGSLEMKNHMRCVHQVTTYYKCVKCSQCFLYKEHHQEHIISCTKGTSLKNKRKHEGKCKICMQFISFKSSEMWNHLLRVHREFRYFKCGICLRSFKSRQNLKQHSFCHNNMRSFKCSKCSINFKSKTSLYLHDISFHQKVYPFTCSHCESKFKWQSSLIFHERMHMKNVL